MRHVVLMFSNFIISFPCFLFLICSVEATTPKKLPEFEYDQLVHANRKYQDTTTPLRSVGPPKIEGVLTNGGCLILIYRATIHKKTPTKTDPSMMYLMISPDFPAPTP